MMSVALAMVGCAGSGTGTGTSGALTVEESAGEASGSFVDDSEADLGRVDFTSRFVDTNVLEIVLDFHGLTVSSLVDFDNGVVEYDGFASDNGEDTQILDDDRALMLAFSRALDTLGTDASEPVSRLRSFANTWADFPSTLDPQGLSLMAEDRSYSSMCSRVNTYQRATHDCWSGAGDCSNWAGCSRGDDNATTDYAYVSMHGAGSCNDGTFFHNGSWQCYEPDHSSSVEYAYGNCLGRCGSGCGSSTQFTWDCFDHDQCVRTGHDVASAWCDDEFSSTVDDWASAPNC
ncbi:MAG: hypothetical protein M3Y87_23880 [Myxococcota bacterium]|nr:hypothetical protein [Myxococcota bacterium]